MYYVLGRSPHTEYAKSKQKDYLTRNDFAKAGIIDMRNNFVLIPATPSYRHTHRHDILWYTRRSPYLFKDDSHDVTIIQKIIEKRFGYDVFVINTQKNRSVKSMRHMDCIITKKYEKIIIQ